MSFSVWLKPPPVLSNLTSRLVDEHASELGTARFVPHVTLLGGFASPSDEAALSATRELAKTLRALHLKPTCHCVGVQTGKLHYQCVYLRQADDADLHAAHAEARKAFGAPAAPGEAYMPHLSIIYGDLSPEERDRRASMVTALLAGVPQEELCFEVTSLALWRTPVGETETWTEVAEVSLDEGEEEGPTKGGV